MNTHEDQEQFEPQDESDFNSAGMSRDADDEHRAGATLSSGAQILEKEAAHAFAIRSAQSLLEDKCTDVVVLDVTGQSPVTGFIVIGSGTSARQMRSALHELEELAEGAGTKAFHITTDDDSIWLIADFVDVVVHLFEPNARSHYDLEGLWSDAQPVDVPALESSERLPRTGPTVYRTLESDSESKGQEG